MDSPDLDRTEKTVGFLVVLAGAVTAGVRWLMGRGAREKKLDEIIEDKRDAESQVDRIEAMTKETLDEVRGNRVHWEAATTLGEKNSAAIATIEGRIVDITVKVARVEEGFTFLNQRVTSLERRR